MQNAVSFFAALATLLPAALFLLPLYWRREKLMFTIPVQPEFLRSPAAAAVRRTYCAAVVLLGLAAFAACYWSMTHAQDSARSWPFIAAPLVEAAGLFVAWGWAWNRTVPHRLPHAIVRTASLTEEPPGAAWWASTLGAWALPAAAAAYLQHHWLQIPERFPTHWGLDGRPNGWTDRTVEGVFWPLGLAAALIAAMSAMGWLFARYASASPIPALKRMTLNILRFVCWLLGAVFAGAALLPLLEHPEQDMLLLTAVTALCTLLLLAYAAVTVFRDHNFEKLQLATPEQAWKLGMFYYNPQDAALFVPKRMGYGYTLNFARPAAWIMVAVFLVVGIAPAFFLHGKHPH